RTREAADDVPWPHCTRRAGAALQHLNTLLLELGKRTIPLSRRTPGRQLLEERRVIDERRAARYHVGRIARFEHPLDLELGRPRLVDLDRSQPEADPQIGAVQRIDEDAVGGHAADYADEVRAGLVEQ